MREIQEYYEAASDLLHFYSFRTEIHKQVWELHCYGHSIRQIAGMINLRKFKKTWVHAIIAEIQFDAGLKNG